MHQFYAIAFEENLSLRQLAPFFPNARVSPHEIYTPIGAGGGVYIYSFGALVTHDIAADRRESEMSRLRRLVPKLTAQVVREDYIVAEDPGFEIGVNEGMLRVDRFTAARAGVVALTVAQSAAMEYYERIVDGMFTRTSTFVERLERHGTVSFRTRPLHRFIGEAITTRAEVLSILHLLDKPDATWEDRAWIVSTMICGPSSTLGTATRRWSSSCAARRKPWSCCLESCAIDGFSGSNSRSEF